MNSDENNPEASGVQESSPPAADAPAETATNAPNMSLEDAPAPTVEPAGAQPPQPPESAPAEVVPVVEAAPIQGAPAAPEAPVEAQPTAPVEAQPAPAETSAEAESPAQAAPAAPTVPVEAQTPAPAEATPAAPAAPVEAIPAVPASPAETTPAAVAEVAPVAAPPGAEAPAAEPAEPAEPAVAEPPVAEEPPALTNCPACNADLAPEAEFCGDCGFSLSNAMPGGAPDEYSPPETPLKDRYKVGKLISKRIGVHRFEGEDLQAAEGQPKQVVIVISEHVPQADVVGEDSEPGGDEELAHAFDGPAAAEVSTEGASWPSPAWEKNVLEAANSTALPRPIDFFVEGDYEFLVEQYPEGNSIWDAWWDVDTGARYGWLIQIATGLRSLQQAGAMLEGVQPDLISISKDGEAVITNLTDIFPLPVPESAPIRGTLYTAPELLTHPEKADGRANLYSFGAMLYSLEYLGHNLEEKDFEKPYSPMLITERYPDVHPAFNRLIIKSFVRELGVRFPTGDAEKIDPSGMTELIETLEVCKRNFERVRLDIAAWTTTGMIRTGNEDAFSFMHACESRLDDVYDYALLILCDGMGGYEAGEIAAAMTIELVREELLAQPMFAALAGRTRPEGEEFDVAKCQEALSEALKNANRTIYSEARKPGSTRRGMGCTADIVYVDDCNIVVGHVGDSRVYHVSNNTLKQLTRDQTLVNRLVELGMITEEEAEDHDRKNELQQAVGGQPEVGPGVYHAPLKRGDWILVCSDGLTGHIKDKELEEMLTRETAATSEDACRRLLNLVNLRGATDNSTIVLVRTS